MLNQIQENTKYFLTLKRPFEDKEDFIRARVVHVFSETLTFQEIPLPEKLHPNYVTSIPFSWVVSAKTLHDVIGPLTIDDVIIIIDEFV